MSSTSRVLRAGLVRALNADRTLRRVFVGTRPSSAYGRAFPAGARGTGGPQLQAAGTDLVTTEPKYASTDANCCPSQLRIGTLRWTGATFQRTFRIANT